VDQSTPVATAAQADAQPTEYLPITSFDDPKGSRYEVEIDSEGVLIYSECCASRMSDDVARKVHEALGRYLADRYAA
jgi:hypothetical protein